jgi:hypothetical protein
MDSSNRRSAVNAGHPPRRPPGGVDTAKLDRATLLLVRAAYDDWEEPVLPEELVARVLRARRANLSEWINALTGLAASPLLALSIGL